MDQRSSKELEAEEEPDRFIGFTAMATEGVSSRCIATGKYPVQKNVTEL